MEVEALKVPKLTPGNPLMDVDEARRKPAPVILSRSGASHRATRRQEG